MYLYQTNGLESGNTVADKNRKMGSMEKSSSNKYMSFARIILLEL